MKRIMAVIGLTAVLPFASACSISTGPEANTTNTAATANTPNSSAQPSNTTSVPASNASDSASANTSSQSSAEGAKQDFTLVNSTGVEINKLYISPHDKNEWGEDILGRVTLPDGQGGEITFNRNEKAALWDLRVEDSEGNSIEWENLNLLEISKITLFYENGRARAETQ